VIAESIERRGGSVYIIAIEGEADSEIERFPHTWVNWGQIGRILATLRRENGRELIIAGAVTRPDPLAVRPDWGFFASLPHILALLAGGDDSVLKRVVRFFESQGFTVRGAHEVAPDLLARPGPIGAVALSQDDRADARVGFAVRRALGPFDVGQAVVVDRGQVLAIEGAEGTDAMLQRVAELRRDRSAASSGVLAKGPKPGQELRVDMPAVGPRTLERAAAAGLAGVALEAGGVLVLDRPETVRIADAAGCALEGLEGEFASRIAARSYPVVPGRTLGRHRPGRRAAADIATGLALVECLAPFSTGRTVAVARTHVLAVAAAEHALAMLRRVRALKQWGDKRRKRRIGVLVHRASADDAGVPGSGEALFASAAEQGLAGVALTGPPAALEPYERAARAADRQGLFLIAYERAE
jgi:DUF1009 family protein